ncbi:MAG: hypothetical protein HKN17_08785 [Rhodothermales bacterium]|nr:hypothetical protein [Rhodothermales bacterium]
MIEIFQIAAFILFNGVILLFAAGAVIQARSRHESAAVVAGIASTGTARRTMNAAADRAPSRPLRSGIRTTRKVR